MLLLASFFGKCFVVVFLRILKEMCGGFAMGCVDCIVRDCVLSLARVPPPLPENDRFAIIFSLPSFAGGELLNSCPSRGRRWDTNTGGKYAYRYLANFFTRILYTTNNTSDVSAVMHSSVMNGATSCMRKVRAMMRILVETMMRVARECVKPASSR